MEFDDFDEPVPVRRSLKSKILENISHYGKFIVSAVLVISAIVTILTSLGIITPFNSEIPTEEVFVTRIIGDFTESLEMDLSKFMIPHTAQTTLGIEGVVPHLGWVKITIENFTHHPNYNQNALQAREIETWDENEFRVDRGNFQKEIDLKFRFKWMKTFDYPIESGRETFGSIGNIFLKAE